MNIQTHPAPLCRLVGKKFVFQGSFGYSNLQGAQKASLAAVLGATVVDTLDKTVDYLVIPDLSEAKTAQKKAQSLNARGAAIQIVDVPQFNAIINLNQTELTAIFRNANDLQPHSTNILQYAHVLGGAYGNGLGRGMVIQSENFEGLKLAGLDLSSSVVLNHCSFVGAVLDHVKFDEILGCDFSKASGRGSTFRFRDPDICRFVDARFTECRFTGFANADFSNANLESCHFNIGKRSQHQNAPDNATYLFTNASLRNSQIYIGAKSADFQNANLERVSFVHSRLDAPIFKDANLQNASFYESELCSADFTDADLRGVNFADADLSGSNFTNADVGGANFTGAKLVGVDLALARNHDRIFTAPGAVGPALTELESVSLSAKRIKVSFLIQRGEEGPGDLTQIDTRAMAYAYALKLPQNISPGQSQMHHIKTLSDALLALARLAIHWQVRFETLDVVATQSPKSGKELRDLVIAAIAEAFNQTPPSAVDLAKAVKAYREPIKAVQAAAKKERQAAKAQADAEEKRVQEELEKAAGNVNDLASFLKSLQLRIDAPKIEKATSMLKDSGFKLFNDATPTSLLGVIKSQSDPDLIYACRITSEGEYCCCTQNLNICGGLRGSICKHLLVLIIGLVQANKLDPATINAWVASTKDMKATLDRELMAGVFIRYKGAEAGEVDWHPTQTVPEDYYSL